MSVKPEDIAASRALRDQARAIVTAHLAEVRADLSAQSIGQRIKLKASEEAVEVLDQSREVVADNKLVVGATVAALVGWLARRPLLRLFDRLVGQMKLERLLPWRVERTDDTAKPHRHRRRPA